MKEYPFDNLAKEISQNISRRSALKLIAGFAFLSIFRPRSISFLSQSNDVLAQAECTAVIAIVGCTDGYERVPKPNTPIEVNGCGSSDSDVPDSFLGLVTFTEDCNNHDRCYSSCDSNKPDCDINLGTDMGKQCWDSRENLSLLGLAVCNTMAGAYAVGLLTLPESSSAYFDAQQKHCQCCPVCQEGEIYCDGVCVEDCGGCAACPPGQRCSNGFCCDPCAVGDPINGGCVSLCDPFTEQCCGGTCWAFGCCDDGNGGKICCPAGCTCCGTGVGGGCQTKCDGTGEPCGGSCGG